MSGVMVVLAFMVTYRLTRLVTGDYLTETPRRWLQARLPEKLAYLIGCPYCASFWLGFPVAGVAIWWGSNRVVLLGMVALAASGVVCIVADHAPPPDDYGTTDDDMQPDVTASGE